MMTQYKILKGYSAVELEEMVKTYMKEGWETLGGICIFKKEFTIHFCQAMGK